MEWNKDSTEQDWFSMATCPRSEARWQQNQACRERWLTNPYDRIVGESTCRWLRSDQKNRVRISRLRVPWMQKMQTKQSTRQNLASSGPDRG